MNTSLLLRRGRILGLLASLIATALFSTGCASRTIEAASTKLEITTLGGRSVVVALPKELDASDLLVEANPGTGTYRLSARKITTKSEGVIGAANTGQTEAIMALSSALQALSNAAPAPAR